MGRRTRLAMAIGAVGVALPLGVGLAAAPASASEGPLSAPLMCGIIAAAMQQIDNATGTSGGGVRIVDQNGYTAESNALWEGYLALGCQNYWVPL